MKPIRSITFAVNASKPGAIKVAEKIDEGVIVTVFPDDASKYSDVIEQIFSYK